MAADDVHAPTNAGPEGDKTPTFETPPPAAPGPGGDKSPTFELPPAAAPGAVGAQERPEVQVGIAFAGGLVAALILKRLGR